MTTLARLDPSLTGRIPISTIILPVNFSVMELDKAWKRMPEWTFLISGR
jgi:hypothetical protein